MPSCQSLQTSHSFKIGSATRFRLWHERTGVEPEREVEVGTAEANEIHRGVVRFRLGSWSGMFSK